MYIQALKGYEEVLGAKDVSTLLTVSNLGSLYSEQGKPSFARWMGVVAALQDVGASSSVPPPCPNYEGMSKS